MARELGKHLHEVMGWPGPMTYRQWRVWQEWLAEQWNIPSRTDWYLMQLTADVRSIMASRRADPKECKLSWRPVEEAKMTLEQADALARAKWLPVLSTSHGA